MADDQPATTAAAVHDDNLGKYKRLLSMARSSLEANQASLQAKDKYIQQLTAALEVERSANKSSSAGSSGSSSSSLNRRGNKEDDASAVPRKILCRVDVEGAVWVLIEYEDGGQSSDDVWKSFSDEHALQEFIQRIPGVPLIVPHKRLSTEESRRIEEDSRRRVERIVEEFRRYKVRTEIAKKQKESENRQALINGSSLSTLSPASSGASLNATFEKAMMSNATTSAQSSMGDGHLTSGASAGTGANTYQTSLHGGEGTTTATAAVATAAASVAAEEVSRLKSLMKEQEMKLKQAYDKVLKENEILRSRGGEALVAMQWRARYESCLREKEDLAEKLKVYTRLSDGLVHSGRTAEQAYIELEQEYMAFRNRVLTVERRRLQEMTDSKRTSTSSSTSSLPSDATAIFTAEELLGAAARYHTNSASGAGLSGAGRSTGSALLSSSGAGVSANMGAGAGGVAGIGGLGGGGGGGGATHAGDSKVQYLRHTVFQYLSCKDPEVKEHIELALVTLLRLTEQERAAIEGRKREESQDTLTSLSNFLGSLSS